MNDSIKKKYVIISVIIVMFLSVFVIWSVCIPGRTGRDYNDIEDGVDKAQESNGRAGKRLDDARDETQSATESVESGLKRLDNATDTTRRIKERTDDSEKELTESKQLIRRIEERNREIKRIINDVEAGNQESGTQTDSIKKTT